MFLDSPHCHMDLAVEPSGLGCRQPLSGPSSGGRWAPFGVSALSAGPGCLAHCGGVRPHHFVMLASAKEGGKAASAMYLPTLCSFPSDLDPRGRVPKTDPRNPLPESPIWTITEIGCWVLVGFLKPGASQALTPYPLPPGQTPSPCALPSTVFPSLLPPSPALRCCCLLAPSPAGCLWMGLDTRVPGGMGE